jgi:hypothetical protein
MNIPSPNIVLLTIILLLSTTSNAVYIGDCLASSTAIKSTSTYYTTEYSITLDPGEYCDHIDTYNFIIAWTDDFAGTTTSSVFTEEYYYNPINNQCLS